MMPIDYNQVVLARLREIVSIKFWENELIKINFDEPFTLVSGKKSPLYINCRPLISDTTFQSIFVSAAKMLLSKIHFDVIAGGESAGIPFASFLSYSMSVPMIYVRKRAKEYGTKSLIEGKLEQGQKVLLVEDLITDAGSKLKFIEEIIANGGLVNDVLVVLDRGQGGQEKLGENGISLHALTNLNDLLAIGEEIGVIESSQKKKIINEV